MLYTFVEARYRLCHTNMSICSICSRTTLIIVCIDFVTFHFIVRYSIYIIRPIMLFVDLAAITRNWFLVIIDNPLIGDISNWNVKFLLNVNSYPNVKMKLMIAFDISGRYWKSRLFIGYAASRDGHYCGEPRDRRSGQLQTYPACCRLVDPA